MINRTILLTGLTVLLGSSAFGQSSEARPAGSEDLTIITADRLVFDNKQHFAYFESNVVVTDPLLKMTSDDLKVTFSEKNEAKTIVARGHVVIEQEDRKAWAGQAVYDVEEGTIVLTIKPRVKRGMDILTADTITFDRDDEKMICEPRARLIIHPDQSSGSRQNLNLFGE